MLSWLRTKSSGESSAAPVLLLILIVALPTAAVLWLVSEATQNERFAVRQRLTDVYRSQLEMVCRRVSADWRASLAELDAGVDDRAPSRTFAACAGRNFADSVIVLDSQGRPLYPAPPPQLAEDPAERNADWLAARHLEFAAHDYAAAAKAYERIAREASDANLAGRAVQAQVRSLVGAGQTAAAV